MPMIAGFLGHAGEGGLNVLREKFGYFLRKDS